MKPKSYSKGEKSEKTRANVLSCKLTVNDSPVDVVCIIKENNEPVHKLWELESIGTDPVAAAIEDELAYKRYVDSVEYTDGQDFVHQYAIRKYFIVNLVDGDIGLSFTESNSSFKDLISKYFYVDNLQGTTADEMKLMLFYANANEQIRKANMPLRDWVTYNTQLRSKVKDEFLIYTIPSQSSILGLTWNVASGLLGLKPLV
ncbi:hypothetical protein SK128_006205 [Halocaridina rubra]|uniref:Uncharacterized protein n=1 Tax=Halocaridina rubra TaxID=373956 RepID=A0AAN9FUA0_HALRR